MEDDNVTYNNLLNINEEHSNIEVCYKYISSVDNNIEKNSINTSFDDQKYFLAEINPKTLSIELLEKLLEEDDVNVDDYKIYLKDDITDNYEKLTKQLLSEISIDYYNNKNLILYLQYKSNKNFDQNRIEEKYEEYNKTFSTIKEELNEAHSFNSSEQNNIEIQQNDDTTSSESLELSKKKTNLSSKPLIHININKINSSNSNSIEQPLTEFCSSKNIEKILYPHRIYYLYTNPLIIINDKSQKKEFHKNGTNDYFKEIQLICNIYKKSNISAELRFEQIKDKMDKCMEFCPEILHINAEFKIKNNNLCILLDKFGVANLYPFDDMEHSLQPNNDEKNPTKLLIISSQKIENFENFNGAKYIKNRIYLQNETDYKNENFAEKFIELFYKNLINGDSIQTAYNNTKKHFKNSAKFNFDKNSKIFLEQDFIIYPKDQETSKFVSNINNIKISYNILNISFITDNYHRIIGRNLSLCDCIFKCSQYYKVFVFGKKGVGKKSFIFHVGKLLFEREIYKNLEFIEIQTPECAREIIENKVRKIKQKNQNMKTQTLLLIYLNYFVNDLSELRKLTMIFPTDDKTINYLTAFSINFNIDNKNMFGNIFQGSYIILDSLNDKRKHLLDLLTNNAIKKNLPSSKFNYPSDIYLLALYIKLFTKITNFNDIDNRFIIRKIIEEFKDKNICKILSIFCILNSGIKNTDLTLFFDANEIEFIKNKLKLIIPVFKNENNEMFSIDNYLIIDIVDLLDKKKFLQNIKDVLKIYSCLFRYLVNYSFENYDVFKEFHAGVNSGIWYSFNKDLFDSVYNEELVNNFKTLNLVFDSDIYLFNTINILEKYVDTYFNEYDKDVIEYISQISICLPTIFHFQKNFIFRDRITEFFIQKFTNNKKIFYKEEIRLKMFKYWFSWTECILSEFDIHGSQYFGKLKNSKNVRSSDESEKKRYLDDEYKAEFKLIQLIGYLIHKKQFEDEMQIKNSYEFCKEIFTQKNNYFNLSKLNLIAGKIKMESYKYEKTEKNFYETVNFYYNSALQYSEIDPKGSYFYILSKIFKARVCLKKKEFKDVDNFIDECENYLKTHNPNNLMLKNNYYSIKNLMDELIVDKENKYKKTEKYALLFYMSNPLIKKNEKIHNELNNSFFLKYSLVTRLPKHMKVKFNIINQNFLEEFKKCINNPLSFIYIGSDEYDDQGNLYAQNGYESLPLKNEKLFEIVKDSKKICNIIILGYLNSKTFALQLPPDKFNNIIYINNNKNLLSLIEELPVFYPFFLNSFFKFVISFCNLLCKEKRGIKEAYESSYNQFSNSLEIILNKYKKFQNFKQKLFENGEKLIIMLSNEDKNENYFEYNDDIKCYKDMNDNFKGSNFYNFTSKFFKERLPATLYILNSRVYANQELFIEILELIKRNQFLNLYGNENCGKTALALEICKYYSMNNFFEKGIFYINFIKYKKLKERIDFKNILKYIKKPTTQKKEILLIVDNIKTINNILEIIDLDVNIILISNKKLSSYTKLKESRNEEKNSNKNIIDQYLIKFYSFDINKERDVEFLNEYADYLRIKKGIHEIEEYNNIKTIGDVHQKIYEFDRY